VDDNIKLWVDQSRFQKLEKFDKIGKKEKVAGSRITILG
jgi:hypothetical protein